MIKCLTLHQPWATLIAIGAKKIETRSWWTGYRGPLAISASKSWDAEEAYWTFHNPAAQPIRDALKAAGYTTLRQLPLGAILSISDLTACDRMTLDNLPPEPERSFGDYTPGRYMWRLHDTLALPEPIPVRGMQGLWTPEAPILEQLEAFWRAKGAA